MDQQARALDVPQELRAQPGSCVRALDQARNVGDHKADFILRIAHRNHAKIRLQSGERIVGDLRPRRRDARDQRGLTHVRISDQADIRQQLQFKPVVVFFAGASILVLARRLMHRSGKARIAASTAAAAGNHHALIGRREIEHLLARFLVVHDRPDRNFQKNVFAFAPGLVRAFAVASALGFVFGIEAEMHQRVMPLAGFHDHVSAFAAVAARRPAARNKFLPAKGHAAIAAVARLHPNFCLIDKHGR